MVAANGQGVAAALLPGFAIGTDIAYTPASAYAPHPAGLAHRRRLAADLLRPGPVLRPSGRPQYFRLLRVRTGGAVVAGRPVDGRDDIQRRHAEPGDRHRPPQRGGWELGLVGVRAHG